MTSSRRSATTRLSPQRASSSGKQSGRKWNDKSCPWLSDGMPHLIQISVPAKQAAVITGFLRKNPEVCVSKLFVSLMMKYISERDPSSLSETEITHTKEPSIEDVKWFLAGEIVKTYRAIGHNIGPSIIASGMKTSVRIAQDRWKAIWNAPARFGFYIKEGYLMPTEGLLIDYRARFQEGRECHSKEETNTNQEDHSTQEKLLK